MVSRVTGDEAQRGWTPAADDGASPTRDATGGAVSKEEIEQLAALRYALRQFSRKTEIEARRAGLTPQQYLLLLAIKGFPGREQVTVGELAERLQIRHHSAVGLADRLEAQKLVKRASATSDRRKVYLSLTRHGSVLLERLAALHHEELVRLIPQLHTLITRLEKGKAHTAP